MKFIKRTKPQSGLFFTCFAAGAVLGAFIFSQYLKKKSLLPDELKDYSYNISLIKEED